MERYPAVRVVFDRLKKASKTVSASVLIEVQHKGRKKYINTGVKVFKNEWDPRKLQVVSRHDMLRLNSDVQSLKSRIDWYMSDLKRTGSPFEFSNFGVFVAGADLSGVSFEKYAGDRLQTYDLRQSTRDTYRSIIARALKSECLGRISDITTRDIEKLDVYLRGMCGPTRRQSTHKLLKRIFKDAEKETVIKRNPYAQFDIPRRSPQKIKYLTKSELAELEELNIQEDRKCSQWELARDLFLFCAYTGLALSDALDFNPDNIQGETYKGARAKTGTEFVTVMLPKTLAILQRYGGSVPPISRYNYKNMIRKINKHISAHISSHTARHTFATTVALANGVPIAILSKMLGHSNIPTTQIYAKVLDRSVQEESERLKSKLL